MPFVKGNTIGAATRFKTGQSGNPAGRPPDRLRKRIEAELEKIASSKPGEARTKLELLAENIVSDALRGDSQSRKLLIERLYPMSGGNTEASQTALRHPGPKVPIRQPRCLASE